jgi:hypothetical protein
VEIPIITWNGENLVRISAQGYKARADVDTLVEALAKLLPHVTDERSR